MKDKLISALTKILVFLLVAGFSFLVFVMVIGSLGSVIPGGFVSTVLVLAAYVVPIILGLWVTNIIHKSEDDTNAPQGTDIDADINDLINKEDSVFTVIKEEISCWNWQLVAGGLIFCWGFGNLLSSFFFAIVLLVLGLGLLSIGYTKYKEKQEMQERELKRKIMAAMAKSAPVEETADHTPVSKPQPVQTRRPVAAKSETHRVAGVTFYKDNIMALSEENDDYNKTKRELIEDNLIDERIWKYEFYPGRVTLIPEPDNPEDPNAIKVFVDEEHIGYIKRGSCSHVRKLLDNHAIQSIGCEITYGPYKHISEEYDEDADKDVYVLEKGEANLSVRLEIFLKPDALISDTHPSKADSPNIEAERKTVLTEKPQANEVKPKTYNYVLVPSTMTFHKARCRYARITQSSNKGYIDSRSDAIYAGYTPCKYCKP